MNYTYLVGEGEKAIAIINVALAKRETYLKTIRSELQNYPDGTEACEKRHGICGFLRPVESPFNEDQCKEMAIRATERFSINGVRYQAYEPDKRGKKGKELISRRNDINSKKNDLSEEIVKATGTSGTIVGRTQDGRTALMSTSAGSKDNKIFIRLPGTNEDAHKDGDAFPTIPEWQRKPEGDEFEFFLK